MDKKVFILWRDGKRGTFDQNPPGARIASTISGTALRNLAKEEGNIVFVLELSEDKEEIEIVKL